MDKIDITRHECRRASIRYQIRHDALFVLTVCAFTGRRRYRQACYNLYNLSLAQICDMVHAAANDPMTCKRQNQE